MALNAVERELREATKVRPLDDEDRQAFFKRLIAGAQDLSDDKWEDLTEAAAKWVNTGQARLDDDVPVPEFPGTEQEEDSVTEGTETTTTKTKATKKKASATAAPKKKAAAPSNGKSAAAPKKKKVAAAKVTRETSDKFEDGIKFRIKKLVIANTDVTVDDIITKLSKNGEDMSRTTVMAVRSETRHTLRVLKSMDRLKGVEI